MIHRDIKHSNRKEGFAFYRRTRRLLLLRGYAICRRFHLQYTELLPRVYLASLDAVQLPLILALLLQKLFFNQWNVNWDRPENRTAFSRRGINGNACGPLSRSTPFCSASPSSTIHVHGREEVKIKQHSSTYSQVSLWLANVLQ